MVIEKIEEIKSRQKLIRTIENKSKYYDDKIILIDRGTLYMLICDIMEDLTKK